MERKIQEIITRQRRSESVMASTHSDLFEGLHERTDDPTEGPARTQELIGSNTTLRRKNRTSMSSMT